MGERWRPGQLECHSSAHELLPSDEHDVVGDYGVWDPKSLYDVEEEFHRVFGSYSCYGFSFDPVGELIDCHQKMGVTLECFPEWPEQVEPPGCEGPH